MRNRLVTVVSVLLAIIGWWGIYELTSRVSPQQPGALSFFYSLLFLAVTATLAPPLAYLNLRIAPKVVERDPWRFLRHSAWGGLCILFWAWLQMHRSFHLGFALVATLIFVALEVLILRVRGQA